MKLLINTVVIAAFIVLTNGMNAHADDSLSKKELYSIFDQVNGFDIETASLGVVQSDNKDVRALAAMVLRDHSMVIQMARDLAKQHAVIYTVDHSNAPAVAHKKALTRLRGLSGKEFDKAYLKHEVDFHRAAINAVKTVLMPAAKGTEFDALLQTVLPGFEHHLDSTEKLAVEIGAI